MTIADDIIQHVNNFVGRQKKQHRRLQGLMKEVDNSNSAIGLVQELAVMMNEINTACELYGGAFKPALDALWAEILATKKEAEKIVQGEADEPPVTYAGSHWVKGFPEITDGDIQNGQLFILVNKDLIYHVVVTILDSKTTLRAIDCEYEYLWEKGEDFVDWHMRIPQIPAGK